MPSAEITSYKPTSRDYYAPWNPDTFRLADHQERIAEWFESNFCWQLMAMLGLRRSQFAQDGTGMVAVEQHIQYERELHAT